MKRSICGSIISIALFFFCSTAFADCTIDAGPLYFGNMENPVISYPQAGGSVTVNCASGDSYTVEINTGTYFDPHALSRRLRSESGDFLLYELKQEDGTVWGDGQTMGYVLSGTGTGSAVTHTVNGQIIATGSFPIGSYSDTVIATVKWSGGSAPWPARTIALAGVVEGSCTVSSHAVNFGQIRLPAVSPPRGSGGLTVNCTPLLSYRIELGAGSYYMHPMRRMKWDRGEAYLGYSLCKDEGCMQQWEVDAAGAETGIGTGLEFVHHIYGMAWPMGNEPVGFYRDDVIARISW